MSMSKRRERWTPLKCGYIDSKKVNRLSRDFALLSRYWQRGGKWSLETIANLLHDNWL